MPEFVQDPPAGMGDEGSRDSRPRRHPGYGELLSESDLDAIRRHVDDVSSYEAARGDEVTRLKRPHRERIKDFQRMMDEGADLPASEVSRIKRDVDAGIVLWEESHPPPASLDTPAKLLAFIKERLQNLETIRRLGRAGNVDPEVDDRNLYLEARDRALAFARLVPTLPGELPECHDPIVGLQNIRACFAALIDEPHAPGGVEATAATRPEALAGESPGKAEPEAKADPLTLDDRAVALFTRWMKGPPPKMSKRKLAEALGCHHSSLKSCPTFLRLWESNRGDPKRGYQDARTGNIETDDDD